MRHMIFDKYDQVTAYILEYIEDYTKYTKEELAKLSQLVQTRKNESGMK